MSYILETLNRGMVEPCGIVFGNSDEICLGDLPSVPIAQFAEYSTETLLQIIGMETVSDDDRKTYRARLAFTAGRLYQQQMTHTDYKFQTGIRPDPEEEFHKFLRESVIPKVAGEVANPGRDYLVNPFIVEGDHINISNFYMVSFSEFVHFSTEYLAGGMAGFHKSFELPEELKNSVGKLLGAAQK